MIWRAYYTEGRTYDSTTTTWNDLPETGVLVVIVYNDHGKISYNGGDWYWLDDEGMHYVSSKAWGTWQPKPTGCQSCVKQGVAVPDEEFRAVYNASWASEAP